MTGTGLVWQALPDRAGRPRVADGRRDLPVRLRGPVGDPLQRPPDPSSGTPCPGCPAAGRAAAGRPPGAPASGSPNRRAPPCLAGSRPRGIRPGAPCRVRRRRRPPGPRRCRAPSRRRAASRGASPRCGSESSCRGRPCDTWPASSRSALRRTRRGGCWSRNRRRRGRG